jgi:hypothetical protein
MHISSAKFLAAVVLVLVALLTVIQFGPSLFGSKEASLSDHR